MGQKEDALEVLTTLSSRVKGKQKLQPNLGGPEGTLARRLASADEPVDLGKVRKLMVQIAEKLDDFVKTLPRETARQAWEKNSLLATKTIGNKGTPAVLRKVKPREAKILANYEPVEALQKRLANASPEQIEEIKRDISRLLNFGHSMETNSTIGYFLGYGGLRRGANQLKLQQQALHVRQEMLRMLHLAGLSRVGFLENISTKVAKAVAGKTPDEARRIADDILRTDFGALRSRWLDALENNKNATLRSQAEEIGLKFKGAETSDPNSPRMYFELVFSGKSEKVCIDLDHSTVKFAQARDEFLASILNGGGKGDTGKLRAIFDPENLRPMTARENRNFKELIPELPSTIRSTDDFEEVTASGFQAALDRRGVLSAPKPGHASSGPGVGVLLDDARKSISEIVNAEARSAALDELDNLCAIVRDVI